MWLKICNTFIIFIVSGFWHGASWTFIVWGFLNALYIMPSIIFNTHRNNLDIVAKGKYLPTLKEFASMMFTFALTVLAWIFFRAISVRHALDYIRGIFSSSILTIPNFNGIEKSIPIIFITFIFLIAEWLGREEQYALANLDNKINRVWRHTAYYTIVILIFLFGGKEQEFIYFQF